MTTAMTATEKFNLFVHKLANTTDLHIVYKQGFRRRKKLTEAHGTLNAEYLASIGEEVPENKFPYIVYYDVENQTFRKINCKYFLTFCKD